MAHVPPPGQQQWRPTPSYSPTNSFPQGAGAPPGPGMPPGSMQQPPRGPPMPGAPSMGNGPANWQGAPRPASPQPGMPPAGPPSGTPYGSQTQAPGMPPTGAQPSYPGAPPSYPPAPGAAPPVRPATPPMSMSGPSQPQPRPPGPPGPGPASPGAPQQAPGYPSAQPGFPQPRPPTPGAAASAQPGFPQPPRPQSPTGYQPSQSGFPQPSPTQPGFPQPPQAQAGFPRPGAPMQPGFPQPQQPGMQTQLSQPGATAPRPPGMQSQLSHPGMQSQPQGFPQSQPGFPQSQPGFPQPQPGMPAQPGFPQSQPGMPAQPGFPQSQPGMPAQPGFPQSQPGMPAQPGFPSQYPGYPQQQAPGQAPQQPYGAPQSGGYGGYPQGPVGGMVGGFGMQQPMRPQGVNLFQTASLIIDPKDKGPVPVLPMDVAHKNVPNKFMRSTLTSIPATSSLLSKCKLPFGLHVFPYCEVSPEELPVIQPTVIVRCRSCRTYINPFVSFQDHGRRWRCNICNRVNDLPADFGIDPISGQPIDITQRPELRSAMIEFIAPQEYMVRAPQPAVHVFLLDVSQGAIESGLLQTTVQTVREHILNLPGDDRKMVGFITYDSALHFYMLKASMSQPQMYVVSDLSDVFLPSPTDLLVNVKECEEIIFQLLDNLPQLFSQTKNTQSALGPALQAAFKLMSPTGGRAMVFQYGLPTAGIGKLTNRENPALRNTPKEFLQLQPGSDFYKKFAVDCSRQQIGVDMFVCGSQYCDVATLSCVSKYSSGTCYYYPDFHATRFPAMAAKFTKELTRVITRPLGLEAVMRVRASRGISLHTFHGNFFVRSTDLLALPNVSPDNAFSMQISVDDDLKPGTTAAFQSALLYTTTHGERRIRVHTMSLPVSDDVHVIFAGADQQAMAGLLAKMAVDRALTSKLTDAREALLNVCVDALKAYKQAAGSGQPGLAAPTSLMFLPQLIMGLLKHPAFRLGSMTSLDQRADAHDLIKTVPLEQLIVYTLPRLYALHNMTAECGTVDSNGAFVMPPQVPCTAERLEQHGLYLVENGFSMYLWVGRAVSPEICQQLFNVPHYQALPPVQGAQLTHLTGLPVLDTDLSSRVRAIVDNIKRPYVNDMLLTIVKEDDPRLRAMFLSLLVMDQTDSMKSYMEFLAMVEGMVNK